MTDFEALAAQADAAVLKGWDLAFLRDRWIEAPPPWDYRERAREQQRRASSTLDMGTGGGEFLLSLQPLHGRVTATEGFTSNVVTARENLASAGVDVVDVSEGPALPFADGSFDLILNRHESYEPEELRRVLRAGGCFLTQQVGGDDMIELNRLLQERVQVHYADWHVRSAVAGLESAGLTVVNQQEAFVDIEVRDIAAVIYMLKITPWQIDDFEIDRYRDKLRRLYEEMERTGPLHIQGHRFFIEASLGG